MRSYMPKMQYESLESTQRIFARLGRDAERLLRRYLADAPGALVCYPSAASRLHMKLYELQWAARGRQHMQDLWARERTVYTLGRFENPFYIPPSNAFAVRFC